MGLATNCLSLSNRLSVFFCFCFETLISLVFMFSIIVLGLPSFFGAKTLKSRCLASLASFAMAAASASFADGKPRRTRTSKAGWVSGSEVSGLGSPRPALRWLNRADGCTRVLRWLRGRGLKRHITRAEEIPSKLAYERSKGRYVRGSWPY